MSAQVQSIAEWMSVVIKLTAPAIRPDVAYVQASGMSPIQELEPDGLLSMREFQVQSGPIVEMGEFIGPCYELWREMDVVMRYMRDERQGDEWREVDRMAADDFDRVLLALTRPPLQSPWSSAGVWNIQFSAHDKLAKSERTKGVWEQRIVFRVLYSVTDLVQDWTYSVEYNTLTALKAALNGRPVGTTARLVNARTSELIGVWKVGSTKACLSVDFTKADGAEFADGVDIISQGAGSWSITYGTGIVVVDDAAEFYGYAETSNSDILGTGTHATYARDELQTYTSQGAINLVTGTTNQLVRLVDSAADLISDQRWDGAAFIALGSPTPCPGIGYTVLSDLWDSPGESGDQASYWAVAGGNVLVRYEYSGTFKKWVAIEAKFDGLTPTEQGAWDTLKAAGGGPYTWDAGGLLFGGSVTSDVYFEGLFPAGVGPINTSYRIHDIRARGAFIAPTVGTHFLVAGLGWGPSRNNSAGLTMNLTTANATHTALSIRGGALVGFPQGASAHSDGLFVDTYTHESISAVNSINAARFGAGAMQLTRGDGGPSLGRGSTVDSNLGTFTEYGDYYGLNLRMVDGGSDGQTTLAGMSWTLDGER